LDITIKGPEIMTPTFLEGLNGTLFVLLIFACFMFGIYIAREMIENGYQRTRLQAAISIVVFFTGEAVIRGWVWYWRHLENRSADISWMDHHPALLVGLFIQILGVICVIRVFAPDSWGRNIWFVSSLFAVGVVTAFMYC
jgi:hypothetical protein